MSEAQLPQPESSQGLLRRYLTIPPEQRLQIVENNLATLVQAMLKEEPGEVGIKLHTPAVMLDIVREIRLIKAHLGLTGAEDSRNVAPEQLESPTLLRIEPLPDSEIP